MAEIRKFFKEYSDSIKAVPPSASDGKIYELYCLAQTVKWLKARYSAQIRFVPTNGSSVNFKSSPGNIDRSRPYFEISANGNTLELHTDIEVQTLGSSMPGVVKDNSGYHEIDLVLISPCVVDGKKPRHDQLFLGVECKAHANFSKGIVKQVLGVRRELSMFNDPHPNVLDIHFGHSNPEFMRANPASIYWLAFTDPKGRKYSGSPKVFEIEFKTWRPSGLSRFTIPPGVIGDNSYSKR